MRMFVGMILGALLLTGGIYIHDSMSTSSVASGETVAQERRTIVNWDVASSEWDALKMRTQKDWVKLTSN